MVLVVPTLKQSLGCFIESVSLIIISMLKNSQKDLSGKNSLLFAH